MPKPLNRRLLAAGTAAAALAIFAAPVPALAQARTFEFNIPAQDLGAALRALARASGEQIIFRGSAVRGRRSSPLVGAHSVDEALRVMLQGTGLGGSRSRRGILVVSGGTAPAGSPPSGEVQAGGAAADSGSAEQEIVVTGTHISGVTDTAAPSFTIDREEIANAGYSTVAEAFESLPQNFDEVTPDGRFANEGGSLLRGLNNSRVVAVDLRGLGAQSTLTLVNGQRRAGSIGGRVFDISTVPLAAVERIEVVTGGRSAIYGADAVAGVVNLVTRRDYDGAESQAYLGFAPDGGGERLQLSQVVGVEGSRGGFVAAYEFAHHWPLELFDAGLLSRQQNPEIPLIQLTLNAQADTWRHSAYLAGHYEIADGVEIWANALYTDTRFEDLSLRRFTLPGVTRDSFTDTRNPSEHLGLSGGLRADLGGEWKLNLGGGASRVENSSRQTTFIDLGFLARTTEFEEETISSVGTVQAIFDGPLFAVAGITPRAAIGVEWRREGYESFVGGAPENDLDRDVWSAFAELDLPLIENGSDGARRLEVSLAGRYDDYSDVGGTFNPQAGLIWEPLRGLTLRGAYSSAFRAPALVELAGSVDAFLELVSDPTRGGAQVPVLFIQGENPGLAPEKADTWTLGVDYEPVFAPWARLSASYFQIDYDGRIEQPSINADRELVLDRADRFPGLVTRAPTAAQAAAFLNQDADGFINNDTGIAFNPATQDILAVFPNLVLFDNRVSNIAVEGVKGLDVRIDSDFETGIGHLSFGLNLTHTFEHERRVTPDSPAFSLLNEVGKPVDTRARAQAGWRRGAYSAFVYVNHAGGYANPFSDPPSRIGSWTTVDLTLRFDGSQLGRGGFLNGLGATLSIQNLFDSDPPVFRDSLIGVLYDSANASPFGRYISLRLTKRW